MSEKKSRVVALKTEPAGAVSDLDDEEIALLVRNFRKYLMTK